MFVRDVEDVGEVPLRLEDTTSVNHTTKILASVSEYLVQSICLPCAFEMVFEPEGDRLYQGLQGVETVPFCD